MSASYAFGVLIGPLLSKRGEKNWKTTPLSDSKQKIVD